MGERIVGDSGPFLFTIGHSNHSREAFLERLQPVDAFDQCRFARTGRSAYDDHFALRDTGGAVLQDLKARTVPFVDMADLDHGPSADYRDAGLQAPDQARRAERDREIDDRSEDIHLDQPTVPLGNLRGGAVA